jgi:hypothetical protein
VCHPLKALDRAFGTDLSGEGAAASAANNAKTAADAAQAQKDAEAAREASVAQGKQSIDTAFAPFNDDYFKKYQTAQVNAGEPQIADQYNVAADKLNAQLTERGVQNSSIAGGYYNTLDKTRGTAEGALANSAADAANALRNSIQTQKNSLYSLNSTGADPATIATQAIGSATTLAPPQNYTALGDLFSGVLSPLTKAATAYNYSPYPTSTPTPISLAGGGNARVVA